MPKHFARLPKKQFLYTLDQVAFILEIKQERLHAILWYHGRNVGIKPHDKLFCTNIMPEGEPPEWRVPENSLKFWLRSKGVRVARRGEI